MIRKALEYIVGLSEAKEFEIGGRVFTDKSLYEIETPRVSGFNTTTLSSMVEYISKNPDLLIVSPLIISIESPTRVVLKTRNKEPENFRDTLIIAEANLPNIAFGRYMDVESFIIQMQSKFSLNEDAAILMRVVGNIKEEQVKQTSDDGFSQAVTARTGIARVEDVLVPNPVKLMPFRTFIEIEQPESMFVFRMQSGPTMALFEADGGAWRNVAISNIKSYFDEHEDLKTFFSEGKLVVLA